MPPSRKSSSQNSQEVCKYAAGYSIPIAKYLFSAFTRNPWLLKKADFFCIVLICFRNAEEASQRVRLLLPFLHWSKNMQMKPSMWLQMLALALGTGVTCDSSLCPASWKGDGFCDLSCMTAACSWDSGLQGSDCAATCVNSGCGNRLEEDPYCRSQCNIAACGWDWGRCAVCSAGCND